MTKTLKVTACEGRTVPIHANDNPTGGALLITSADGVVELADSPGVRRRIRAGDLAVYEAPKPPKAKTETTTEPATSSTSAK